MTKNMMLLGVVLWLPLFIYLQPLIPLMAQSGEAQSGEARSGEVQSGEAQSSIWWSSKK